MISLEAHPQLVEGLVRELAMEALPLEQRCFPDGEHYVRVEGDCKDAVVILMADMRNPDRILLPLVFLADLLHELGAQKVVLVAPYLAYMRQDIRFKPGEAISSRSFAALLSAHVDGLVTVDPHLHRYHDLAEIYRVPSLVLSSTELMADWIRAHVELPVLVGPDAESVQWVQAVAAAADVPYTVLHKIRHGDRDVEVSMPELDRWRDHTPVLIDDIVSSGHTLLETLHHLRTLQLPQAVCVAVHGIFAGASYDSLKSFGVRSIVTSNSLQHTSNALDLTPVLVKGIRSWVQEYM
ncbi:MAG: ribose-phosphate diphosphokinase [Pseudomonadales bacterium]|nr:ribose-phosphate diphosphokinase [Pseudomonadales bacterium]